MTQQVQRPTGPGGGGGGGGQLKQSGKANKQQHQPNQQHNGHNSSHSPTKGGTGSSMAKTAAGLPVYSISNRTVVDMSFMELASLEEVPEVLSHFENKPRPGNVTSIKLGDNSLVDISRLIEAAALVTINPAAQVRWVDLSCNKIASLDGLQALPQLSTLNLQGNNISSLTEVKKLAGMKGLKSLSLHGNSIENKTHYRNYVIHHLPSLRQFDFGCVTKSDRDAADMWALTFRKKLNPELR